MLEKQIEAKLRKRIKAIGGLCLKFESPGYVGVPDRIILLPGGHMAFVELKAPGKKERPLQQHVQGRLRQMGFTVFSSVDGDAAIEEVRCWATDAMRKATHSEGRHR